MHYQPYLRPGFPVDPVPEPRAKVKRLMIATSVVVEGLVDHQPGRTDPRLANCLYMKQAGLVIMGTACRRPMMLREAANISAAADTDVLIVRPDESVAYATFDLKCADFDKMLCGYRMWMTWASEGAWLVPMAGEAEHVRMTPVGLEVHHEAPFANDWERQKGLTHAREFLSVAVQGWF